MRRCSTKRRARPSPIADRDRVVAAAGAARDAVERSLRSRLYPRGRAAPSVHGGGRRQRLPLCEGVDTSATALMPILCNGDLIGSVALTGSMPDEAMVLLVKVAAAFLGKQMEE